MNPARFSDAQIMGILRQAESGMPVSELCREHGMSSACFYKWRSKYGGTGASMVLQMKAMVDENLWGHCCAMPREGGRTKAGMNTKLHPVTDTMGRPIRLFMTASQVSDYSGARALVSDLPAADCLVGDRAKR